MKTEISLEKLKELEKAQRILSALESGGVDNWEGYSYAMQDISKEEDIEELIQDFVLTLHEDILVENVDVDFPAGMEAGPSVTISDEGALKIEEYILQLIKDIKGIEERP